MLTADCMNMRLYFALSFANNPPQFNLLNLLSLWCRA
jgi:hypothetical protein